MSESAPRVGLILGGGGSVGVAWELGALAAIERHSGWNPATATVIVGTSAGSLAGSITALGRDLNAMVDRGSAGASLPEPPPPGAEQPPMDVSGVLKEFLDLMTSSDAGTFEERARRVGEMAMAATPTMDLDAYREFIGRPLHTEEWPDSDLRFTTCDCITGDTVILDRNSGLDLVSAVAASCAVPTIFPTVPHGDRVYTDGPRTPFIVDLVDELSLDAVVFVGIKLSFIDGVDEHVELDALAEKGMPIARVITGPRFAGLAGNLMDPAASGTASLVGRHDGEAGAASVREVISLARV